MFREFFFWGSKNTIKFGPSLFYSYAASANPREWMPSVKLFNKYLLQIELRWEEKSDEVLVKKE